MGIDFLDLNFRIERHFRIALRIESWERLADGGKVPELTARQVALLIASRLDDIRRNGYTRDTRCPVCRYNLRGLPGSAACPGCGTPVLYEGPIGEPLVPIIPDCFGIDPEEIDEDARLRQDLGME